MSNDNDQETKIKAFQRRERSKIIQTLSSLNVSDDLISVGAVYLSKEHGLQVAMNGPIEPIYIGAGFIQKIILEQIFQKKDEPTQ